MGAQTSSARATSATRLRERDEAYAFARFVRSLSVVDATRASRAAELAHFCEYMSQQSIASPKTSHRQIYSDISNILRRVDTPLRPSSNVERLFARSLLARQELPSQQRRRQTVLARNKTGCRPRRTLHRLFFNWITSRSPKRNQCKRGMCRTRCSTATVVVEVI